MLRSKEEYSILTQNKWKTHTCTHSRILFSYFQHRSLSWHQHTLVMKLLKHPQGAVGHDDLVLRNLEIEWGLGEVNSTDDRGHCDIPKKASVWQLTGTPRMWESWSAFVWRRQFPAFVTKTTGTANCPWESTNFSNALFAAGIGILPRTSTPSMSNNSPKRGCGCRIKNEMGGGRFVGQ